MAFTVHTNIYVVGGLVVKSCRYENNYAVWIGGGGSGGSGEYDCVHHTASCPFSMVIYA